MIWRILLILLLLVAPAWAAPSIVTSSGGSTAAGTSHVLTMPTGIVNGNLLILSMAPGESITSLTTLAGWTKMAACSNYSLAPVNVENWYRHADGTEGATITVTSIGSATVAYTIRRIQDHKPSTAPECAAAVTGFTLGPDPPMFSPAAGSADYLWIAGTAFGTPVFPTVAGTATGTTDPSNTSHTIPLPGNIVSGDLLVVLFASRGSGTQTWPSGWTTTGCNSSTFSVNVRYKIADGTEGASITVTQGTGGKAAFHAYRIIGWHGTTPPECGNTSGTSTTPDPPALNPAGWDVESTQWIAGMAISAGAATISADPASYTSLAGTTETSAGSGAALRSVVRSNAVASENPGAFTISASVAWSTGTIGVRPGSSATLSTYPSGYTANQRDDGAAPATRMVSATRTSTAASENPGAFALSVAEAWYAFTIAVQPNTTTSPPAGFSLVSGNSWTQAGGVATPINGFSVITWATASGPAQQAACTISAIPDENWTFQIDFRLESATDRYYFEVLRVPGTNNDVASLKRVATGVPTVLKGPINLGVDIQVGDKIGVDVTAGGAIKGIYWSVDAAWANLCAGGGDWCIIAEDTTSTNPTTSYIGMGAKEPSSCTLFAGTLSAAGSDTAPSIPQNCTATLGPNANTELILTCDASTDDHGVVGYEDQQCADATPPACDCANWAPIRPGTVTEATTFLASGLSANTLYCHRRRSVDTIGQQSAFSSTFSATTLSGPDTTKPTAPTNVQAAYDNDEVDVTWSVSTDTGGSGVSHYTVERGDLECLNFVALPIVGHPAAAISETEEEDFPLRTPRCYRVKATDFAGNDSDYSSTVTLSPPAAIQMVSPATPPPDLFE